MHCPQCSNPKALRFKRVDFDYSNTCGIPGVTLEEVKKYSCPECHNHFFDLGDARRISDSVANVLLAKPMLRGGEMRFLRTHCLDKTIFELADLICENPRELTNIEKANRQLPDKTDRDLRDLVLRSRLERSVTIEFEF